MSAVMISDTSRQWANNLNELRDRWSIRREVATEKEWMPVAEFEKSLVHLSRGDLISIKNRLLETHSEIKKRLDVAKKKLTSSGRYSDRDWFIEVSAALKSVNLHLQVINGELSKFHERKSNEFDKAFVHTAKELLPEEIFNQIKDAVWQKIGWKKIA